MNYKHFLITRFSVPYAEYQKDKSGASVRDEYWLNHRFELFEKYCFPSVQNQNVQDFQWLVFFDIQTPVSYKKRITQLENQFPLFKPFYVSSGKEFNSTLHIFIETQIKEDTSGLITSRLDNDDALHICFMERVRNEALEHTSAIFNFSYGLTYDEQSQILFRSKHLSNPFLTRVELINSNLDFKTVMDFEHLEASKHDKLIQITDMEGWLVTIHDKNMVNSKGGKPVYNINKRLIPYHTKLKISSTSYYKYLGELFRFYYLYVLFGTRKMFK